jgi:flagellar basal-body rod protein FlgC
MNAERIRMEVASQNIANSRVTKTESGEAYRRQQVVFESVLQASQSALAGGTNPIKSVQVARIEEDKSPLKVLPRFQWNDYLAGSLSLPAVK